MRKMTIFVVAVLGLCGALVSAYADTSMDDTQECAFSVDEQNFASRLSDDNKMAFCNMTTSQRADCMKMMQTPDAYGNKMTPDQAVQSMATTGGCNVK